MAILSQISLLLLACASLQLAAAVPIDAVEKRQSCAPVHIIIARASTEAVGEGLIGGVADNVIRSSRQQVTKEAVNYPALLIPYGASSTAGTAAVKSQLTAYVNRCPNSKVVLMGYSQGAHIIGDAMCGGGGVLLSATTTAIDARYSNQVVAVLQMGDPRHTSSESYKQGTARGNGLFPRTLLMSCERFASKFRSYCDTGDTFCDSGLDSNAHMIYVDKYGTAAAQWLLSKIGN